MAVVSNLFRVSTAIRRKMEAAVLAPDRLSWTSFVVLWVLWVWGEMESRALADAVGISPPTTTGVVMTLERRGLVQRERHASDGRRVRVSLTRAGRRKLSASLRNQPADKIGDANRVGSGTLTLQARQDRSPAQAAMASKRGVGRTLGLAPPDAVRRHGLLRPDSLMA